MSNLDSTVQDVFKKVFRLEVVPEDASPITIDDWDSINHLVLMLELESALGISINTQDYAEMVSYRAILEILRERGVGND